MVHVRLAMASKNIFCIRLSSRESKWTSKMNFAKKDQSIHDVTQLYPCHFQWNDLFNPNPRSRQPIIGEENNWARSTSGIPSSRVWWVRHQFRFRGLGFGEILIWVLKMAFFAHFWLVDPQPFLLWWQNRARSLLLAYPELMLMN
jgi:hypothetical protein